MESYNREGFTNYPGKDDKNNINDKKQALNYYRILIVSVLLVVLLFCVLKYLKL